MLHGEAPVATGRVLKSMEMALFSNILGILSLTLSPYIYIYIYSIVFPMSLLLQTMQ